MNFNNINNSGNGNTFNQNIGNQTINGLFNINDLAIEYRHRNKNRSNAQRLRIKRSSIQIGIAVILLIACFFIVKLSGGFDGYSAFLNFLRDLSINAIASLATFASGLLFGGSGIQGFYYESADEKRNKSAMKLIDMRVSDLGYTKKDWKKAKKSS